MLQEANEVEDPVARAAALDRAHRSLLGPGGPHRARLRWALATELIGESARTRRHLDRLTGLLWQTVDLFLDGDRHAERRLAELKNALAQRPEARIGNAVAGIEVMLAIRAGQLDRAEAAARACFERGTALGDATAAVRLTGQLSAVRWYQGRIAELRPVLAGVVDNPPYAALALSLATEGDRPAAERVLAALRRRVLTPEPRSVTWLAGMHGLVEAAYLLDDADTCADAYEELRPYADLPVMSGAAVLCLGSGRHAVGVAALGTGRLDEAVAHLRLAVQDNLALRHWPALIASRVRLAQALTRRGQPDDLTQARAALTAAAEEAASLGLPLPKHHEPAVAATCRRDGQQWLLRYRGRSLRLPPSVGLSHLAVLLANPGREIPAVELASGLDALRKAPALDHATAQRHRERLEELTAAIDEFESRGEPERAARATAERETLLRELAAAAGLGASAGGFGDYARPVTTEQERARLAVGKAIRRTTKAIARADPQLGAHLDHTVKTGTHCSYRPR